MVDVIVLFEGFFQDVGNESLFPESEIKSKHNKTEYLKIGLS